MLLYVAYTYCYLLLYAIEQSPGVSISLIEDRTLFQFCDPAASLAMGLIVGALLTPLVEEVTNRGLIFPGMLKYGVFKAIIFSSVVFALCHKPSSIITAFGFGLYANIVFLRTGQLWFSFITHATYNSLVISNEYCDFAIRAPMMMVTTREWLIISALTITGLAAFGMYKLLPDKPDQ
jgi:membrane protease YdiL (CAAX protease family)